MIVILGIIAFALDGGIIVLARTQLQVAADSGALAAATCLTNGPTSARNAAQTYAQLNSVTGRPVAIDTAQDVQLGTWDKTAKTFTPLPAASESDANAVRVTCSISSAKGNAQRLFFGRIFGINTVDVSAQCTAMAKSVNCGPFVGLDWVTITGGAYTDSYDSSHGYYSPTAAGTHGHVCSNGTISLSGASAIHGDAHPGKDFSVEFNGGSWVTGSKTPLTDPLSEPAVDPGDAAGANDNSSIPKSVHKKGPLNGSGDFTLSSGDSVTLPPGTYYFRDFKLSGSSTIKLTGKTIIYCSGDVDISGGGVLNDTYLPANCQLYGMGSTVVLSGDSEWYGVVYAPGSNVTRVGNSEFYGMAVGKTLTLRGNGGCHYDQSLGALKGTHSGAQIVQ